jgi:hypothetical protein
VDDTLILCGIDSDHLCHLCCLFLCFEAVSDHLHHVVLINNIEGLARILGCMVSSLPMRYLGLLLSASFKGKPIWNGIIEKVECCLVMLAKSGCTCLKWVSRITLIKSTLSDLPTYLSLFPLAVSIAN